MSTKRTIALLLFFLGWAIILKAQNPNLIVPGNGATFEASSSYSNPPSRGRPSNIARDVFQMRWESNNEQEGAWICVKWDKPQPIREVWIMTQSLPYDIPLEPDQQNGRYSLPRKVRLSFADGKSMITELRRADYFQIITLPGTIHTDLLKITIEEIWKGSGEENTGICKVKAFAEMHQSEFKINTFEMFDISHDVPVQSAKINVVNTGDAVDKAKLVLFRNDKKAGNVNLPSIPDHSSINLQVWIPALFTESRMTACIKTPGGQWGEIKPFTQFPYEKNYFDGGTIDIIATNHNDLGWLNTQSVTADYRSNVLIAPALDLMKTDSGFKYTMESVEYLKEFFIRHPERKEELVQRLREKRFAVGASYVQNLQVQVGQEKLVRQFYYGRRWIKENLPGCDTRFYINTDVPGLTYQLPQILKKSGIDYVVQGRFPWGFYYWQGLDGTSIPVFAFRYGSDSRLMNPKNNTGYLKYLDEREYYYKPRQLNKTVLYDFNSDYLPPCPDLISFARDQNLSMTRFAEKWNLHFKQEPGKQIKPPVIRFTTSEEALNDIFNNGELNIETIRGDWPMSWAYYDEPGHREGLLLGRKGHNALLQAEAFFSGLNAMISSIPYPQEKLDEGWQANCWPDHGWGGNRGIIGDQVCVDSYARSFHIGDSLTQAAQQLIASRVPRRSANKIPVVVYNPCNWTRNDVVTCTIFHPADWKGLELQDTCGQVIPCELMSQSIDNRETEVAFPATNVPPIGYITYYACESNTLPTGYREFPGDSMENDLIKVKFGAGGILAIYDKTRQTEVLKTGKFFGGEVIQLEAPTVAWENQEPVAMNNFDKTSMHEFRTIRAVESPVRCMVEKEARMNNFTLHERFILNKHSREVIVEADILNWTGEKAKELRIVFPVNQEHCAEVTYDVPFGRVEMSRDNIDYSYLPDNYECQFYPERYARKDLPFREAINWVDVSSGKYKGNGCLFASDMTVHLFRDETTDPVDYPVVQHVLLSTRESFGWNPKYSFTQEGSHSYRMALYPHDGNWRFAYKEGLAFNQPLTAFCYSTGDQPAASSLPASMSLLKTEPSNLIVSALKKAEDRQGTIIRFYESEGRFTRAKISGFKPFAQVWLTDMLEYNIREIPINAEGTAEIPVKPYEIITLRTYQQ